MKIKEIYFNGFIIKRDNQFNNAYYYDIYFNSKWLDMCLNLKNAIKNIKLNLYDWAKEPRGEN